MKIRCLHEEYCKDGRYYDSPIIEKFAKFEYINDVNLNSSKYDYIFERSFDEFKHSINYVRNDIKDKIWTRKSISALTKIPLLYDDMMRDGKWKRPMTFKPTDHYNPIDGYGRLLLSKIFLPDMPYDLLFYQKEHDNLKSLRKLISIMEEKTNPDSYKLVDVYYRMDSDICYSRQIEFMKEERHINDYCGHWFTEIVDALKSTLFVEMVKRIRSASLETDDDYVCILKDLVSIDYKFNSRYLAN